MHECLQHDRNFTVSHTQTLHTKNVVCFFYLILPLELRANRSQKNKCCFLYSVFFLSCIYIFHLFFKRNCLMTTAMTTVISWRHLFPSGMWFCMNTFMSPFQSLPVPHNNIYLIFQKKYLGKEFQPDLHAFPSKYHQVTPMSSSG